MRVAQDTHFTDDAAGSEFNLGISDPKRVLEDQIKTVGLFPFADDHLALRDRKSVANGNSAVKTASPPVLFRTCPLSRNISAKRHTLTGISTAWSSRTG